MTINEVTTKTNGAITNYTDDPFMAFAADIGAVGAAFLRYEKGHYYYGVEQNEMQLGTKLAANMQSLKNGWIKWGDGKPIEKIFCIVAEGRKAPERDELGDNDKMLWEAPNKDPWQEAVEIELVAGNGEKYIFNSSTKGGVRAVKKLTYDYARERRSRPGLAPLVELGSDHYDHPNATYGKVLFPTITIVGWVDEVTLEPVVHQTADTVAGRQPGEDDDDIPFDVPSSQPLAYARGAAPPAPQTAPSNASKSKQNQNKSTAPRF